MFRENYCYSFIHDGPDDEKVEECELSGTAHSVESCSDGEIIGEDEHSIDVAKEVDDAFNTVIEELTRARSKNSIKSYQVTGKYLPADLKLFKDEVVIIDRAEDGKSGQGADMCQEEFLKKGLSKVAAGKINTFPVFR